MKAVVKVGGKQYVVAEKETLLVDRLPDGTKELTLDAMLVIDGDKTTVGTPLVKGVAVKANVVEQEEKGDKLRVIRYKAKSVSIKKWATAKNIVAFRSLRLNN